MRRAFTLIEILTGLAVMAVVLSLLVPTIVRARDQTMASSCQSQQRRLAQGLMLLAPSNRGWLPSGPVELGGWFTDPDRGSPIELYNASRAGLGLTQDQGWYGLGMLWKNGVLESGKAYYCPVRSRLGRGYAHAWPREFTGTTPADGKTLIHGDYAYRGGMASQAGTARGPLRVGHHAGNLAVLADSPMYGASWHQGGYNVAFLDGHVRFHAFATRPVPDTRLWLLWQAVDGDG